MGFNFKRAAGIAGRVGLAVGTAGGSEVANEISGGKIYGSSFLGGKKSGGGFPSSGIPKFGMRKTTDFMQNNPNIQIGGPDAAQNLRKSFAGLRDQAQNRSNAALGGNESAIQRRFAANGGSGSGAEIAAISQAHDAAALGNQEAAQNIDMSEQQALQSRDLAQADMDFKNRVFSFDQASKMHELDLAERQQQIGIKESEYSAKVNALINKPPKQGLISNLIDGIV